MHTALMVLVHTVCISVYYIVACVKIKHDDYLCTHIHFNHAEANIDHNNFDFVHFSSMRQLVHSKLPSTYLKMKSSCK